MLPLFVLRRHFKKKKERKRSEKEKNGKKACVTVMPRLRAGRSSQRGNFSLHLRLSQPLLPPDDGIKAEKLLLFRVFRREPRPQRTLVPHGDFNAASHSPRPGQQKRTAPATLSRWLSVASPFCRCRTFIAQPPFDFAFRSAPHSHLIGSAFAGNGEHQSSFCSTSSSLLPHLLILLFSFCYQTKQTSHPVLSAFSEDDSFCVICVCACVRAYVCVRARICVLLLGQ